MTAANRFSLLLSTALTVATLVVAGAMIWRYLDEDRRTGLGYVLLYWPMILIDWLPTRVADALRVSVMPTLLLYFGAYLSLCRGAHALWRRVR